MTLHPKYFESPTFTRKVGHVMTQKEARAYRIEYRKACVDQGYDPDENQDMKSSESVREFFNRHISNPRI